MRLGSTNNPIVAPPAICSERKGRINLAVSPDFPGQLYLSYFEFRVTEWIWQSGQNRWLYQQYGSTTFTTYGFSNDVFSELPRRAGVSTLPANFNTHSFIDYSDNEIEIDRNGNILFCGVSQSQHILDFFKIEPNPNHQGYWRQVTLPRLHADCRGVKSIDGNKILLGTDGGIEYSDDSGASFISLNVGNAVDNSVLGVTEFYGFDNSELSRRLLAGAQDNGIIGTFDGRVWSKENGGDGFEAIIYDFNPNVYFSTSNSALNQNPLIPTNVNLGSSGEMTSQQFSQAASTPNVLYFSRRVSSGGSWQAYLGGMTTTGPGTRKISDIQDGQYITVLEAAPYGNGDVIYQVRGNEWSSSIHYTLDGTNTSMPNWHQINGYHHQGWLINDLIADPNNPERIWIGMGGFDYDPADITIGINRVQLGTRALDSNGQPRVDANGVPIWQWADMSNGLPPFPVMSLWYQEGTDDAIYAATDVGIYRWNKYLGQNGTWECIGNGIPFCLVNEIRTNNCRNVVQVASRGRGIWESPIPPLPDRVISANTTIPANTIQHIGNDIRITAGTIFTVEGTLNMGKGKRILVERGGTLLVDGGRITNLCGETLDGIDVEGTKTATQSVAANAQGKVTLINGATIEHALDAVSLWNPDAPNNPYETSGGIIEAVDAVFRNNWRDVEFMQYGSDGMGGFEFSLSSMTNCQFLLDNDCRFSPVTSRVSLWDIHGVEIRNCDFTSTNTDLRNLETHGIYSIDAGYIAHSECGGVPCPTADRTTFDGFTYAVRAQRAAGSPIVAINDCDFRNNVYGVLLENMDMTTVSNNTFLLGGGIAPWPGFGIDMGVVVNTGPSYHIENNTFTGNNPNRITVGTYIAHTGTNNNEVFNNTYSNLTVANSSEGNNRDINGNNSGLYFGCNNHSNGIYDIAVGSGGGIRPFQGTPPSGNNAFSLTSENRHSRNGIMPDGDFSINNQSNPIFQYTNPSNPRTEALNFTPGFYTQGHADLPDGCIWNIFWQDLTPAEEVNLETTYEYHDDEYQTLKYLYNNLIDEGNTATLSAQVNTQWASDVWDMRSALLAKSPNLSQEVLKEAAETGVLPDALLMEILLANPSSIKDKEFVLYLQEDIPNPLPSYLTNLLFFAPEPLTLRKQLELAMAMHSASRSKAATTMLKDLVKSPIFNKEGIKEWLDKEQSMHAQITKAEILLKEGAYGEAQQIADQLPSNYEYAAKYSDEAEAYSELMGLKANVLQEGRSWKQLTNGEIAQLEQIAGETRGDASIQARNILCFINGDCQFLTPYIPNSPSLNQMRVVGNPINEVTKLISVVNAVPNPAKDYFTIDYTLPEYIKGDVHIEVNDILGISLAIFEQNGHIGQRVVDTRFWTPGIYSYRLSHNGTLIQSGKITIMR